MQNNHNHNRNSKRKQTSDEPGARDSPDAWDSGADHTPLERLQAAQDPHYDEDRVVEAFRRLYRIVRILRDPDGCPWDREQTPESMKESLVEEAYEVIGAFSDGDSEEIHEELGDTILVATMIAYMLEQSGRGSVTRVLQTVAAKLVRRHPHVFGEIRGQMGSPEVLRQWDDIKASEGKKRRSRLEDGKVRGLPPLLRAVKLQKQAAKLGFDWDTSEPVFDKVAEELGELKDAYHNNDAAAIERELGDLLFSAANLARVLNHDPSAALHAGNEKFVERFEHVAREMEDRGMQMAPETLEQMEAFWQSSKSNTDDD